METAIALAAVLIVVPATLLQLALIFEGLAVFGRAIIPFLPTEKAGRFSLWGGWHLVVFAVMFKFMHDAASQDMETFQTVAFQVEGIRIMALWLVLPLASSFAFSRLQELVRRRFEKHA